MSFKIHNKLNRIAEVSAYMKMSGVRIANLTNTVKEHEKILALETVHYMQMEMEFSNLIGEECDHTEDIERLLLLHGSKSEVPLG